MRINHTRMWSITNSQFRGIQMRNYKDLTHTILISSRLNLSSLFAYSWVLHSHHQIIKGRWLADLNFALLKTVPGCMNPWIVIG